LPCAYLERTSARVIAKEAMTLPSLSKEGGGRRPLVGLHKEKRNAGWARNYPSQIQFRYTAPMNSENVFVRDVDGFMWEFIQRAGQP
jgi:hypothetical protein